MKLSKRFAIVLALFIIISCSSSIMVSACSSYEEGNMQLFYGIEYYNSGSGPVLDPDWIGLSVSGDFLEANLRLGGAFDIQHVGNTQELDYAFAASARYLTFVSFIVVIQIDGLVSFQNINDLNNLGWAINGLVALPAIGLRINSGSVKEGFDAEPVKKIAQDSYVIPEACEDVPRTWVNVEFMYQYSNSRRDSIIYSFAKSSVSGEKNRHDVGYKMRFAPYDTGFSLELYTGLAFASKIPVTMVNKLSIGIESYSTGALLSLVLQNGVGGQALWISSSAWVNIKDYVTLKLTASVPLIYRDWDVADAVLFKPISDTQIGLSILPNNMPLTAIDLKYNLNSRNLKIGLNFNF